MRIGCSTPSSPPNPAAWAWDCRSAVRSWKPMAAGCGPRQTYPTVPRFNSPCRCTLTLRREVVLVGASRACAIGCETAAVHESPVDAVDGSSTAHRCHGEVLRQQAADQSTLAAE